MVHVMAVLVGLAALALTACGLPRSRGGAYSLQDSFEGPSFFDHFEFFTDADPTQGFVDYVGEAEARKAGLVAATNTSVYIGADSTSAVPAGARGRKSVRLASRKAYDSGLFVIELTHMPTGCGTWPAFWLVGPGWPSHGEIDIIEGVHKQTFVQSTLHTSDNCSQAEVDPHKAMTGRWGMGTQGNPTTNCYIHAPAQYDNQGCGVIGTEGAQGAPFNKAGGGTFATEWTATHIQMFFFPVGHEPADLRAGHPEPSTWGLPYAFFQLGSDCLPSHFSQNNIIFDLTFCGSWAGATFAAACPGLGACNDYVRSTPSAFAEAHWNVTSVRVFQAQPAGPGPSGFVL